MRRLLPFFLSLVLFIACLWFLNHPVSLNKSRVPPLGMFFSPFTGFWQNADSEALPFPSKVNLKGLNGEVEVVYDQRLVPHIFAEDMHDLLFAQGYITARHRLWQMDISTRAVGGMLAEVLGNTLLERDLTQRRKGLLWAAEKTVDSWKKSEADFAFIQSYIDGVNTYIDELSPRDYPLEFKLMQYAPPRWDALRVALFYKSMEETLNSREDDREFTNLTRTFGEDVVEYLFPEWNPRQSPVVPEGTKWDLPSSQESEADSMLLMGQLLLPRPYLRPDRDLGSNNWAVSGSKTRNGHPILCNDPHLRLTLPSIWFEIQLNSPQVNTYGVSFPGIPGVILGFNENIAWGSTNGSQDVLDWHEITWTNDLHTAYFFEGKERPVEYRVEEIRVRGRDEAVIDSVIYTHWGPVVEPPQSGDRSSLAMRWIAHDAEGDFVWKTFWGFNSAKNHDDFVAANQHYGHPIQNFVFASNTGDIAIRVTGYLPLKYEGQGRTVLPGNDPKFAWQGFVPFEHMPAQLNPERGFVSSANQHSTGPDYPYYYNGYFNDYRGRLINRKLASMNDITVEDMIKLQNNNYSILAEEAMPRLMNLLDTTSLSTLQNGVREVLKDWNYRFDQDIAAPALFWDWMKKVHRNTWDEMFELMDAMPMRAPEYWRTLQLLNNDPMNVFFDKKDTPEREGPGDIVTLSFKEMTADMEEEINDPDFNWPEYRSSRILHMARIPAFSGNILKTGGFFESINALKRQTGPSWRMVVELGPEVRGWGVYPGGQSGNPGSPYYDNFIDEWAKGEYFPLFFMKDRTDRSAEILKVQHLK